MNPWGTGPRNSQTFGLLAADASAAATARVTSTMAASSEGISMSPVRRERSANLLARSGMAAQCNEAGPAQRRQA